MERLTEKDCECLGSYKIQAKNLDYHCVAKDKRGYVTYYGQHIDKLAEYENLEDKGLLLKLPCKAGIPIWWFNDNKKLTEGKIVRFAVEENGISFIYVTYLADKDHDIYWGLRIDINDIGRTAFFHEPKQSEFKNEDVAVDYICKTYSMDKKVFLEELHELERFRCGKEYSSEESFRSASIGHVVLILDKLPDRTCILYEFSEEE